MVAPPSQPVAARAPRPLVDPDGPETPQTSSDEDDMEPSLGSERSGTEAAGEGDGAEEMTVKGDSTSEEPPRHGPDGEGSAPAAEVEPAPLTDVPAPIPEANGEAEPQGTEPPAKVQPTAPEQEAPAQMPQPDPEPDGENGAERQEAEGAGKRLRGLFRRGGRS